MKDYTYQDMLKMQEEAAVRVREMKKRAAVAVESEDNNSPQEPKQLFPDEVKHISYPVDLSEKNDDSRNNYNDNEKKSGLLDVIKSDNDSILILFIILLLSQEDTDYLTSLALLYLLL